MTEVFLALGGMALGGIAGFLAARLYRGKAPGSEDDEAILLRRQVHDLAEELKRRRGEEARDLSIASQLPIIVRKLGERLTAGAIPGIAVRIAKDFFRTPAAGFFALQKDDEKFILIEGTGFPHGWKGTRRFSSADGILGVATRQHIVMAKEEYLAGMKTWPLLPSTLEEAGVLPDLVAPVVWGGVTHGALVVAGSAAPLGKERPYASMLADMVASAFHNSFSLSGADQKSATDELTGAYSANYFGPRLEAEIRRARNYMAPLSLLFLDIDHFRKINEAHGQPAGDAVLKSLVQTVRKITRSSDFLARYGGEEFVVVMTASGKDQAFIYADQLRKIVAASEFRILPQDPPVTLTVSIGIASFPDDGESASEIIRAADKALTTAKEKGRNRVVRAAREGLTG